MTTASGSVYVEDKIAFTFTSSLAQSKSDLICGEKESLGTDRRRLEEEEGSLAVNKSHVIALCGPKLCDWRILISLKVDATREEPHWQGITPQTHLHCLEGLGGPGCLRV